MKTFDIILTSWNRLEYLKRTIGSLIQSGAYRAAERVIIVDNGSTEEGLHEFLYELRKEYGTFLVILPHNEGWGKSVNEAIGMSRAEYLFVCNNDVEFERDFHERMFEVFNLQANIGILGVWRHISHGFVANGVQNENFREMDNVPAIGWMMPKYAMKAIGMLPEHGPCLTKGGNGEDTQYVNLMKQAGFLVGVPKNDLARHIDGY
jgi:GT2 family glycosyltransferase